jgi:hypothetical protein
LVHLTVNWNVLVYCTKKNLATLPATFAAAGSDFCANSPVKKTDASLQHIQLLIRPPARPRAFPHGENKLQPFLGAKGDQVIRNSFGCCRIVQNSDLSVAVDIHTCRQAANKNSATRLYAIPPFEIKIRLSCF